MSAMSRLFSLIGAFDGRGQKGNVPGSRAHDALVLLATLAKSDGTLGESERAALASAADAHIGNRADALAFLDDPDQEGLDDVAARIRRTWTADERGVLIAKAAMVAEADGSIGEIEEAMLERLARLLDVSIPQASADDGGAKRLSDA
ncbi:MAG: TerB family tellurite resistance protein [Bosea sp. (in: a-proteobacteria)]